MNHTFKLIWSRSLGMLIPVAEVMRTVGHGGRRLTPRTLRRLALRRGGMSSSMIALLTALATAPALAQTLPTGGSYVGGAGNIATAGSAMTITQSTTRGIINWQGFSIGAGGSVMFDNGRGATLNRVTGANESDIDGALSGTGSIFLINPNGVVIGPDGTVITGGSFVASSRDVSNSQFMNGGALEFSGSSSGTVTNLGKIVSQNGDAVLIGEAATNAGSISAPKGTAAVAAGNEVVLSAESGPAGVYVAPDTTATGDATNTGTIKAAAAALASAGGNVYALAGNTQGLIQASGTKTVNGQVWLTAPNGSVNVQNTTVAASDANGDGGTIIANGKDVTIGSGAVVSANGQVSGSVGGTVLVGTSAPGGVNEAQSTTIGSNARITATGGAGGTGGQIETSGQRLVLGTATVDAGDGGSWVLDPVDLTVDATAATTIDDALGSNTDVTLETTSTNASSTPSGIGTQSTGDGNIVIASGISWSTTATLTLSAYDNVEVDAPIMATGAGVLYITYGNAGTNGPAGAALLFGTGGSIQFTGTNSGAPAGSLTIQGTPYTLVQNVTELQAINSNSSGNYALAEPIDASGTTYSGPLVSSFDGVFNGLGNTISNLTINSSNSNVGLFGVNGGVVENVGLLGDSVAGGGAVGGLVGVNVGLIESSYATGAASYGEVVGGLVGVNVGLIESSYATGPVSNGLAVGGLVGVNYGSDAVIASNSYATGAVGYGDVVGGLVGSNINGLIESSYATGAVSNGYAVGGLVGYENGGTIANSYATGAVTDSGVGSQVGGLVGYNFFGTITDAYATGAVNGGSYSEVGGLVGFNYGTIEYAYAVGAVAGGVGSYVGGLVGYNTFLNAIADAYWVSVRNPDGANNPTEPVGGGTKSGAGTNSNAFTASDYGGFNFTNAPGATGNNWVIVDANGTLNNVGGAAGATLPMLASEYQTTIVNAHQLQLMAMEPGATYTYMLGANIDASATGSAVPSMLNGTDVWGSNGFIPIASFAGTFNGEGYTISDLTIASSNSNVGLFGTNSGLIKDVGLVGDSVTGYGGANVGGLVGNNYGTVMDAYATGAVIGGNFSTVGGLVGVNNVGSATIMDAYATGAVYSGNGSRVGGLAGANYGGMISNAYATGAVTGGSSNGSNFVGGLVGYNSGMISDAHATGNVTDGSSNGSNFVGGLVGLNIGSNTLIADSYASGDVTAGYGYEFITVGGLAGANVEGATVANAYATGDVTGGSDAFASVVGGLVGSNYYGVIANAYATGDVTGGSYIFGYPEYPGDQGGSYVGGLVGRNVGSNYYGVGTIANAYATGNVTGGSSNSVGFVGGLVGYNDGAITNSYETGDVTVTGSNNSNSYIGSLVGYNDSNGTITKSYANGSASGGSKAHVNEVNGIIGSNNGGTITNSPPKHHK